MVARNVEIPVDDIAGLLQFAKETAIDLTVVGPEYPLTLGIVDTFRKEGLRIFGASQEASQLESSKSFTKEILNAAKVKTAGYRVVTNAKDASETLQSFGIPIVLKADGLASGKGVFVCHSKEEASLVLQKWN